MLEIDSTPVVVLEVKVKHFICNLSIFELASVDNHRLSENSSVVVFPGKHVNSFGLQYIISFFNCIVNCHLVGALSNLSFTVEHETTSKSVNFVIEWARGVRLPTLDRFLRFVIDILPFWFVIIDVIGLEASYPQLGNLLVSVIIETTQQVSPVVY